MMLYHKRRLQTSKLPSPILQMPRVEIERMRMVGPCVQCCRLSSCESMSSQTPFDSTVPSSSLGVMVRQHQANCCCRGCYTLHPTDKYSLRPTHCPTKTVRWYSCASYSRRTLPPRTPQDPSLRTINTLSERRSDAVPFFVCFGASRTLYDVPTG